ncbi:MAG: hypothetical protein BroJett039_01280 [Chloroflexota bacterium]|nr:MAG: hypothetical protein BroJett039_01280 [Chloroflexota bacterium]
MARTVTLRETRTEYAAVIAQVQDTGEALIVEQAGKPSVAVLPLAEYERLVAQRAQENASAWRAEQERIFKREQAAFIRMQPELLKTHRGKFVAIHNERLVDSDADEFALANRVYDRFGYRTLLIMPVTERPRIVHIRSPKRVKA